jgi:anti-sigma regulatory factor (Ser/Thr protein kinase)
VGIDTASQRFERSSWAAREARHFVVDRLRRWRRDDLVDDAALVTTELATNAVVHGQCDFDVTIAHRDGVVKIVVSDSSPVAPVMSELGMTSSSGRGLAIVDALAARWGYELVDDGKQVWAELGR